MCIGSIEEASKVVVEKEYAKDIPIIKDTFKNGFNTGINWFLDNLWHDACDLERVYNCRNEHQAYLMGWICDCINKARLGIGNFIEIKDIKE